jgi:hypothetical protein
MRRATDAGRRVGAGLFGLAVLTFLGVPFVVASGAPWFAAPVFGWVVCEVMG